LKALVETPGKVNESALGSGWFIKLKVRNSTRNIILLNLKQLGDLGLEEFNNLLDEAAYKSHLEESAH